MSVETIAEITGVILIIVGLVLTAMLLWIKPDQYPDD